MEIRRNDASFKPILSLDRATKDALATYARLRWPNGTAKAAAAEWGLTQDEGRGLILGKASQATLDRIWKHPRGGWAILLPVMGAVIGEPLDAFIDKERDRHEQQAARLGALARGFRAGADRTPADRAGVPATDRGRAADLRSVLGAEDAASASDGDRR